MQIRFERLPALLDRRGSSKSSHFRDIANGLWTPPVRIGSRCSAWPEHENDLILGAQIASASPDEIRALVARLVAARALAMPACAAARDTSAATPAETPQVRRQKRSAIQAAT